MSKGKYFERIIERLPPHDKDNVQTYVLRQIREKGFFQTVFNTIHEGIIVIDKELKIRYANKAGVEMLGIPENIEEQRISRFLKDVNWKGIMSRDEDEWYKISRREIEVLYPVRRNLLFYVVPHESDKETAIIILHDVTESRMNTLKTFESEKNQLISLLAAGVAHEIGNPINSLHIHLQLLGRKLNKSRKKDDEALELLSVAEREVKRLDMIISQFLQAVRPTAPKMSAGVDLKQIIIETLNFMQYEIEDRNVKVECLWPDSCPRIQGDENQLKQAFYNIMKNAVQSMPDGGTIHIACSFDENRIEVSFSDMGKGISAVDIGRIFEPYYTTKQGGNGLGLMVVERIIREHGAELTVESEPGKGTVFKIKFPLATRRIRMLPAPAAGSQWPVTGGSNQ
ncbi:MAG: ATP-binding protein [Victivallales bacterium]|jgi:signal transduction histidine kinase